MPEGHLVHHYAARHQALLGPTEVSSPQGRFAEEARALDGQTLAAVEAYGKHLFYEWTRAHIVHVHLGMQGLFLDHAPPPPPARRQVRMRIRGGRWVADLIAPRVCALVGPGERAAIVAGLGPDPLRAGADPELVWQVVRRSEVPIGALLLDQQVVAGVGNVLRAEALHAAKLSPALPGSRLLRADFDRLWRELGEIMRAGAALGRIATRGEERAVYKRERCADCGYPVDATPIGGRTSYACPACQPGP